jgi:nucleotide-binding universal stress UspA family protein
MPRILTLLDLSDTTSDVLQIARSLARAMGAQLYLISVELPESDFEDDRLRTDFSRLGVARTLQRKHRTLRILQLELRKEGIDTTALLVRGKSRRSSPAPKILQEIRRFNPDLVVMGSHSQGLLRKVLTRSISDTVVKHAGQPVVLVYPPRKKRKSA